MQYIIKSQTLCVIVNRRWAESFRYDLFRLVISCIIIFWPFFFFLSKTKRTRYALVAWLLIDNNNNNKNNREEMYNKKQIPHSVYRNYCSFTCLKHNELSGNLFKKDKLFFFFVNTLRSCCRLNSQVINFTMIYVFSTVIQKIAEIL